ncbi:unnamed protein product [Paramecium octaurelia]|uniref:Uncharacterized protein n=1 Tax=Paramecium octaurelia TaxID=43137 RepID=A0A8S1YAN2_PAROT|nr:unnamed protein product [Paramecium octaurelia]
MSKSSEVDMNQPQSEIFISISRQQLRTMDFDPRTPQQYQNQIPAVEKQFNNQQMTHNPNQFIASNSFNQIKNDNTKNSQQVAFKLAQVNQNPQIPALQYNQGLQSWQINQGNQKFNTQQQQSTQFQFNQNNQSKQFSQFNQFNQHSNQPAFYQQK